MPQWTPAQECAISADRRSLLVSAAAGSGKTAVLTERIMRRVTESDPDTGEIRSDISRMLIVTFTKAAANELSERIGKALREKLAADPSSAVLQRQLLSLSRAKICTIHSFCFDIIKKNFSSLGISPSSRVADQGESDLLASEIIEKTIDGLYEEDESTEDREEMPFADFTGFFVTGRDNGLGKKLLDIYNTVRALPGGLNTILQTAEQLDSHCADDFLDTVWGKAVADTVREVTEHYLPLLDSAVEYFAADEEYRKKYLPSFEADKEYCERVASALEKSSYKVLAEEMAAHFPIKLGIVRAENVTEEAEKFKEIRTKFKKTVDKLSDKLACAPEELDRSMKKTAAFCRKLHSVLDEFDRKYTEEKRRRSLLDYSDLEILAHRLLLENPAAAEEIRNSFDEVYIDEYQDVNAVQDEIFSLISREDNLFTVGDIKQSIYAFRGAKPDIFADRRNKYPKLVPGEENGDRCSSVFLSDNFRCNRSVIDFVNIVSGTLFTHGGGCVNYTPDDALVCSKNEDKNILRGDAPVCVALFSSGKRKSASAAVSEEAEDDEEENRMTEEEYVASEVKKYIDSGVSPKDIALLMRSVRGCGAKYENALKALGISCRNDIKKSIFEDPAVLLAYSLLHTIDNPTRDIFLTAVLHSPLFGFSLDELNALKKIQKENSLFSLYSALKSSAENGDEKSAGFLRSLSELRKAANAAPADKLLSRLYEDTGLPQIAGNSVFCEGGDAALSALYELAVAYESGSFRGLYSFVRYLDDICSGEAEAETDAAVTVSECVSIMTVHKSKGLEFPICFLCSAGKKLLGKENQSSVVVSPELGVSTKLPAGDGFVRYETLMRAASIIKAERNALEEERRVLYVAMTRARERLHITASVSNPEKMIETCENNASVLSAYTLSENPTYIGWILSALFSQKDDSSWQLILPTGETEKAVTTVGDTDRPEAPDGTEAVEEEVNGELTDKYGKRLDYVYPYQYLSDLPAKLSVSALRPDVLDADTEGVLEDETSAVKKSPARPGFLAPATEAATSAEAGTATHLFMQFCDFEKELSDAALASAEAERLASLQFFSTEEAALIRMDEVAAFFRSKTYAAIRTASKLWRELRFNCRLDAVQFTEDPELKKKLAGEKLLVQGVIDCLFVSADGSLVLLDYKTDRIRTADELVRRHVRQLRYYAQAVEFLLGRAPDKVLLYSFCLGQEIPISSLDLYADQ